MRLGMSSGWRELLAPRTRFQNKISSHRVWDFVRFEMSDVQALRRALGKPKMNDLLLTVVGGGNFVSGMRVALGTDIADPLERLKAIGEASKQGKAQAEAVGGDFMGNMLAMTPYPPRSRMMRGMLGIAERTDLSLPGFVNTTVTNAPNPPGGHHFTGAKVLVYAGFGPVVEGSGLFHTITGMDFEVTISVTSCRELLPDVSIYTQCLRESFAELQDAAKRVPAAA